MSVHVSTDWAKAIRDARNEGFGAGEDAGYARAMERVRNAFIELYNRFDSLGTDESWWYVNAVDEAAERLGIKMPP